MTLLGVLFVVGVAFLATMNFEADLIVADRQRDRNSAGVGSVLDDFGSILRDGMMAEPGVPFGGKVIGESPGGFAELPGVQNIFAPIEPYKSGDRFLFGWFTDTRAPKNGKHDGLWARNLLKYKAYRVECDSDAVPIEGIDVSWQSGETLGTCPIVPADDPFSDDQVVLHPVDADGDGITDTLAFPISELGFSEAQIAGLSTQLNGPSNPDGKVYLGLRVIAHGGMVNLNESHPELIKNVFDLDRNFRSGFVLTGPPDQAAPDLPYFYHRPSQDQVPYSPWLEEPILRRRVLLPPRIMAPSLLHGNPLDEQAQNPFGDMPTKLFPPARDWEPETVYRAPFGVDFETVFKRSHRYTGFRPDEKSTVEPEEILWGVRMEPFTSYKADPDGDEFDRRHLVTTVSYDDLLARGGQWEKTDLLQKMRVANRTADIPGECLILPFEYADYPQVDIPNNTVPNDESIECMCPTQNVCRFDPRKGRLLLSLPWLDDALQRRRPIITENQRNRLIHDVFMMLVSNASGPYWQDIGCATDEHCPSGEVCKMDPDPNNRMCIDAFRQGHRLSLLSRTAASLTANMIDYMDADDIPTRIALRSFDFSDPAAVGRELNLPPPAPHQQFQYVYGLERQPYITEVATFADDTKIVKVWAVELYNPYEDIDSNGDYTLVLADTSGTLQPPIPLTQTLLREKFTVFVRGTAPDIGLPSMTTETGRAFQLDTPTFDFKNGWTVYLVRDVQYPNEDTPIPIVVDQFRVDGTCIGREGIDLDLNACQAPYKYSVERVAPSALSWTWPVPKTFEQTDPAAPTLTKWNFSSDSSLRPVEVNFANTGSFTGPRGAGSGVAFPTTGSLLLLMRHANRSLADHSPQTTDLAFTTWLDEATWTEDNGFGGLTSVTIREDTQVDNGRMPVFDVGGDTAVGPRFAHHVDPKGVPLNEPGGLENLPWGQLVFDYFTALPLSGSGPYVDPDPDPVEGPAVALPDSIPRVDLNGLRVHGRININAAPWKVLAGLPLMPSNRFPEVFRAKIVRFALSKCDGGDFDGQWCSENAHCPPSGTCREAGGSIGDGLAQAIVAYRELREVLPTGSFTGDYSDNATGRGWEAPAPAFRRGTGFLAVGELANIRHSLAGHPAYRIDTGRAPDGDYVEAVARLVALGDWVTVRSDVFTIYGTLRGEGDPLIVDPQERAKDVDTRALRFQETVDRLPTFLGEAVPVRIGHRVVSKYIDVRND